jgi:hypothetical protein
MDNEGERRHADYSIAKSPFQTHQKAYEGYREVEQYLIELFEFKKAMIARGENEEGTMDLMGTSLLPLYPTSPGAPQAILPS